MLKIALVDDEPEFLELFRNSLQNYFEKREILCRIDAFASPDPLYLEFAEGKSYDICFLDIEMPQMDGRELAERIRKKSEAVNLIFLTSHGELMKVGFRLGVFDFITKDGLDRELPDVMERLLDKIEKDAGRFYTIQTRCRYEKIAYDRIIYIYKRDQNIRFVLENEEIQERKSLKKILSELNDESFVLVERGYIINLAHVVRLRAREVWLSNGRTLPVSREHIQNVRNRLGVYAMHMLSDMREGAR